LPQKPSGGVSKKDADVIVAYRKANGSFRISRR